jgi:pimeloyl-ACP methyl ester carboxylesterase
LLTLAGMKQLRDVHDPLGRRSNAETTSSCQRWFTCLVALAGLVACGSTEPHDSVRNSIDDLNWETCDFEANDAAAECAILSVPADHARPSAADRFQLSLKRKRMGDSRAALFLLAGGPGDAAAANAFELSHGLTADLPNVDIYALDQRGTGGSERLTCPDFDDSSERSVTDCVDHLRDVHGAHFELMTTEQSARDLALVTSLLPARQGLMLYGVSYGTYLAQSYLELDARRPTAVALEGVASASAPFDGYDAGMDGAARTLLDYCAADEGCGQRLGPDPYETAKRAVQGLDRGACPDVSASARVMKSVLGQMLTITPLLPAIPAAIHRLRRCAAEDVEFFSHLFGLLTPLSEEGPQSSRLLGLHLGITELVSRPTPSEALLRAFEAYPIATGLEATLGAIEPLWPRISTSRPSSEPSRYDGDILFIQGELDPATPAGRARQTAERFTAARGRYLEFPGYGHAVVLDDEAGSADCGRSLLSAFLQAPHTDLDTSCLASNSALVFELPPATSFALFGTADLWGDAGFEN